MKEQKRFKLAITFILLFSNILVNGQEKEKKFDFLNIKGAYNCGSLHQFDIGASLTNNFGASIFNDIFYYGPYLNMGYGYAINEKQNLMHSNVGYEFCGLGMLFIGRISLNNYTNFDLFQMIAKPEVGLTLMGFMNLTYSYKFNLSKKDHYKLSGHYIGIDFHFRIKDFKK